MVTESGARRWLTVTAVAVVLGTVTGALALVTAVDADHAWTLAALVVAAMVARALDSGGPCSLLALAAVLLLAQPVLHVVGELALPAVSGPVGPGHGGPGGLVVLACHVALSAVLTAVLSAGESAGRALAAALRRLARVLVRTPAPPPAPSTTAMRTTAGAPSHEQRVHTLQPPRRGPPALVLSAGAC